MPFGKHRGPLDYESAKRSVEIDFNQVWAGILQPAIPGDFDTKRADELRQPGLVDLHYNEWLYDADVVLADLTLGNPNVYYELGIRQALSKKGTVLVACQGARLPFDVRNQSALYYDYFKGATTIRGFQDKLRVAIESAAAREIASPVHVFLPGLFVARYPNGLNPELRIASLTEKIDRLEESLNIKRSQEENHRWIRMIQAADTAARVASLSYIAKTENPPIDVLEFLGSRLSMFGKIEDALVVLGMAETAKPDDPEILRQISLLYQKKGLAFFGEAERYMKRVLQFNDGDAELHEMLGDILRCRGLYREALSHCERAFNLDEENMRPLVNMGAIYAALKDIDESLRWYRQARSTCRKRIAAVKAKNQGGERGRGLDCWDYICLAESAVAEGRQDEALEALSGALAMRVSEEVISSIKERFEFLVKIGFASELSGQILLDLQSGKSSWS